MTNRTRELFDFAQGEPVAVLDMIIQLREMDQDEVDHIELVADNVKAAIIGIGRDPQEVELECQETL
jgi:hypothetical protein